MAVRPRDPGAARPRRARPAEPAAWTHLRLRDRVEPGVRVLFVGINPGVRSALTGHHFAGYSNRFWKLLFESGLVPTPITFEQDDRLPHFGFGITNLVARPSPGIDDLTPAEYVDGWTTLHAKIRRYRPQIVALVGVTLYRAIVPLLIVHDGDHDGDYDGDHGDHGDRAGAAPGRKAAAAMKSRRIKLGRQADVVHGARVFVLPNPSGRNANFTYAEMLAAFRGLRRALSRGRSKAETSSARAAQSE